MYDGNDRNRGGQGVELIRIRPHDAELDERIRRAERNGRGSCPARSGGKSQAEEPRRERNRTQEPRRERSHEEEPCRERSRTSTRGLDINDIGQPNRGKPSMGTAERERNHAEESGRERSRMEKPRHERSHAEEPGRERSRMEETGRERSRTSTRGLDINNIGQPNREKTSMGTPERERYHGERIERERSCMQDSYPVREGYNRNHPGSIPVERRRIKKMKRSQRRIAMLSTCVCTILLCVAGIHLAKTSQWFGGMETANAEGVDGGNPSQEVLGPPAPAVSGDILQREQDPEHENPLIVIDPGHGGTDTGCDRAGVLESEINMQIANRLAGKLKGMGYEVLLLREDDMTDLSLEDRVAKTEAAQPDIFVSIHQNAYDEDVDDIKGIETYHGEAEGSIRLAELIHKGAVEKTGAVDREIQGTGDLYVLRKTSMPSCLIETAFLSSQSDRGNIVTGEYQDQIAEGIAQGINTYFTPKTMYLTFDDGPSADNTSAVLDILKERNIKATFFVVGENVKKHPDVARRIVEEGHTIGIHCNSHNYKEIYKSVDSYLEDFQKAYDAVYEATGVEAKLFRFPGGSVNAYNKAVGAQIIEKMTEMGYIYFDWNASLEDAVDQSTPEALVQNAVNSTLGRKKVVMLAHDVIYNTTQCLEKIIDSFPEYEMKPLTEDVEPIHF